MRKDRRRGVQGEVTWCPESKDNNGLWRVSSWEGALGKNKEGAESTYAPKTKKKQKNQQKSSRDFHF